MFPFFQQFASQDFSAMSDSQFCDWWDVFEARASAFANESEMAAMMEAREAAEDARFSE